MTITLENLIYFTAAYPYSHSGAERWKYNDLLVLRRYAKTITVVPLAFGDNVKSKAKVPTGVEVHTPLFKSPSVVSRIPPQLIFRGVFDHQLRRHLRDRQATRRCGGVLRVLKSYGTAQKILRQATARGVFDIPPSTTALFFFWGFGAAEMIPWLPNGFQRIIVGYHGFDVYEERHGGKSFPFRSALLERVTAAAVCSEHGRAHMSRQNPQFQDKIIRRCLGVEDYGISQPSEDGILRLVSCARVDPVKRLELIAEALSKCKSMVEWTHIGGGERLDALVALAKRFTESINHVRVKFLGKVPAENVRKYYTDHAVDCFLSTSRSEGLPVSMMEALAAGIPIIATDVGGVSEIVDPKIGQLLNPNPSPREIAAMIDQFASLPKSQRAAYRRNARSRFEESFRVPDTIEAFAETTLA